MKRLFNTRKKSEEDVREQGNTLDRIVKDKEGVKKRLEEEEKSFMNKKREYERKMIEFEKQEVTRREQEIEEKKTALEDLKRKNQLVQDKVQEQIKMLTIKLDELRVEHQTNEASSDSIISCLQDKLIQVEQSLAVRLQHLAELENAGPSAPLSDETDGEESEVGLYPSLPTMPRSWHQIYSATQSTPPRSISLQAVEEVCQEGHSLGSSPQISLSSSSRSITPKIDSDSSV